MGKIAFVFSGQGAQYVQMGKNLAESYDIIDETYLKADRALGFSIKEICFIDSENKINQTRYTQPAILTTSVAILNLLKEKGIKPDVVAGLSLGEYTALVAAKAISFEDAVKLVYKRGQIMEESVKDIQGSMVAVLGLNIEKVAEICEKFSQVEVANHNTPTQIVIGGEKSQVEDACQLLIEAKAKRLVPLNVSGPFHTSLLSEASKKLKTELKNYQFSRCDIPVISNVTADILKIEEVKDKLTRQVMSRVRWVESVEKMLELGVDTFIEVGPTKVLSSFIKKIDRNVTAYNVENIDTLNKILEKMEAS